ncbi:MAG: NfeD family protein [Elusimicrobiales bacterium]|jgi:hypothetical protein|nr:NfeD family protein [Elusimicrobiales bacterium]
MPEIAVNYWFWLSLGLLLIVIEMVVPGVFFLWFGIGAFATGIIALICGGLAIKYLTAIFAILSVIAIYLGRKYFKPGMEIKNGLNDSNSKYTGKVVKANGDFENGQGSVILGDTVWQAESDDTVLSGQALTVTGVRDSVLKVALLKPGKKAETVPESGNKKNAGDTAGTAD